MGLRIKGKQAENRNEVSEELAVGKDLKGNGKGGCSA